MKTYSLAALRRHAIHTGRGESYVKDVLAAARRIDEARGEYDLTDADHDALRRRWRARDLISPAEFSRAEHRRQVCAGCEDARELTRLRVRCGRCGCGGVSLLTGNCKAGKWPDD